MRTLEYKGDLYPEFQAQGNASQFAIPLPSIFVKELGMI